MAEELANLKAPEAPPGHGDPAWAGFWERRAWQAPRRVAGWIDDPLQDRRLLLYANALRGKFGYVRYVGLPTQGSPEDTRIESLFVEPALSPERIDPNSPLKDRPSIAPLMQAAIDHPRLVVLGDPGSGKSTLVAWLVCSFLSRESNRLREAAGPLVPVPLVLRDLRIDGGITWEKLVERFIAHPTGQALGVASQLEHILYRGQAMVLVDGLDEAGGTQVRRAVVAALQEGFGRYPSVRWVITSRVVGYDEAPLEDYRRASFPGSRAATIKHRMASRLYVAPFDDDRIGMFVRNWHETHETDRGERLARSRELLDAIFKSPHVVGLARVPNLLTMIALVYRVYLRLPDGRALLYERIAQAYLETIETARKLQLPGYALEDMKRWLGYVAFQMNRARFGGPGSPAAGRQPEEQGILVSRATLTDWIAFAMARGNPADSLPRRQAAEAFVDWVARRAGLIIPRSETLFAFAHLSFQEYFAAWFIAEQVTGPAWNRPSRKPSPLAEGVDLPALRAACGDARWHETLVLLFELLAVRGDWSDEVLEQLLAPGDDAQWVKDWDRVKSHDLGLRREELLVLLARDVHSGLSRESRRMGFWRAWTSLDSGSVHFRSSNSWGAAYLETLLFSADGGGLSPALEMLVDPPRPLPLHVLMLSRGATDEVIEALAKSDSARTVTTLSIVAPPRVSPPNRITDRAVAALADPHSKFESLAELQLLMQLTNRGLQELARSDGGLKALVSLDLSETRVGDGGLAELARRESGLKVLASLDLSCTDVTDAGLGELARADTSLKALTTLDLSYTKVTDAGLKELSHPGTGLKALAVLDLSSTRVTDLGLRELARADTGLNSLSRLYLRGIEVTDATLEELQIARPTIQFVC